MKDRFLWFCGGYAVGFLVSAILIVRDMERAILGEADAYVHKAREVAHE